MQSEAHGVILSFALPQVVTIESVEALAAELKQLPLAQKTDLILDASQVQNITTPGLQLIISLEKTLSSQGGMLAIRDKSEAFMHALKDAGLQNLLSTSS